MVLCVGRDPGGRRSYDTLVGAGLDCLEHGHTFPDWRFSTDPLQNLLGSRIVLGRHAVFTSLSRG